MRICWKFLRSNSESGSQRPVTKCTQARTPLVNAHAFRLRFNPMKRLTAILPTALYASTISMGLIFPSSAQYNNNSQSQQYNPYSMNSPVVNPYANPSVNPYANPIINPYANPEINPQANPDVKPCGLYGCGN